MKVSSCLFDNRTKCWSIMMVMQLNEYLELVESTHERNGMIEGQRQVLTTTAAKRIRTRMIDDIKEGAVLPPVVLGKTALDSSLIPIALRENKIKNNLLFFEDGEEKQIIDFLTSRESEISIIDGMQRTEAYKSIEDNGDKYIRVEFWVAENVSSLIYRMLILNTGQVPWTVDRQINVVYRQLIKEMRQEVSEIDNIYTLDDRRHRTGPAQYQAKDLVGLYIAFSNQKIETDAKYMVAEEFAKLDLIEAISDSSFQKYFYAVLKMLAKLDKATYIRNRDYISIFDAQPARIGFVVAASIQILGKAGKRKDKNHDSDDKLIEIKNWVNSICQRLDRLNEDTEKADYLKLPDLTKIIDEQQTTQIGRRQRKIYKLAFEELLTSLDDEPDFLYAWRRYEDE